MIYNAVIRAGILVVAVECNAASTLAGFAGTAIVITLAVPTRVFADGRTLVITPGRLTRLDTTTKVATTGVFQVAAIGWRTIIVPRIAVTTHKRAYHRVMPMTRVVILAVFLSWMPRSVTVCCLGST
jgi:hypothetical protein